MNFKIDAYKFDLTQEDYSIFDKFQDIDPLMITAGFGRLALFKDVDENMIPLSFNVNTIPVMRIIKRFYGKLEGKDDFYCGVMVSIAGFMSSPFFSIYAATKAASILNIKDYARFDFRIKNGVPYLFDIAGTPYTIHHSSISYLFSASKIGSSF